jgi:hypothetical protein
MAHLYISQARYFFWRKVELWAATRRFQAQLSVLEAEDVLRHSR